MKPWEEHWGVESYDGSFGSHHIVVIEEAKGTALHVRAETFAHPHHVSAAVEAMSGRIQLMACVPEAIRLLLENEWSERDGRKCFYCGALGEPGHRDPHFDGCAFEALMKKAGVR